MPKQKLEIIESEYGYDYVELDAETSEYYADQKCRAHFALITESFESLPSVGYLIPISKPGPPASDIIRVLQQAAVDPSAPEPTQFVALPEMIPAIRIAIAGGFDADGYSRESTLTFTAGIVKRRTIRSWRNWRYVGELWTPLTWTKVGFDCRKAEAIRYAAKAALDDETFKTEEDLAILYEEAIGVARKAKQEWEAATNPGDKSRLEAILTEAVIHSAQALKAMDTRGFFQIANVTRLVPLRHRLFLAINLIYNYWERTDEEPGGRAVHLERLGFKYKLHAGTIGHYSQEAGCLYPPRSVVLKNLETIRTQANRYFKKHPEERKELRYHGRLALRIILPPEGRRDKADRVG